MLDRLFSDAEKIRLKCIDDYYAAIKKKAEAEMQSLQLTSEKLEVEIKKIAIKHTLTTVQCSPRPGEPERDFSKNKKCSDLVEAKNALIDRMRELDGWNTKPRPSNPTITAATLTPPCPNKAQLQKIQGIRMFNRHLFETWERCVNGDPESYYN